MTIATLDLERDRDQADAGARSAVYGLLAEVFSFPDAERRLSLASGEWASALAAAAQHLPFELAPVDAIETPADSLEDAYIGAFEVGPGGPFCPPYEGSHRGGRMKLMEEIVRFYEHFGLVPMAGDQADHLCAELEFMHYMAFKEAAALAHGDPADDLRRAQRDFLQRHLSRWLPKFSARLDSPGRRARALPTGIDFYRRQAALAAEYCRCDLAWLKKT